MEQGTQELLQRAEANDYRQRARQTEHSIKDGTKYTRKTLEEHCLALKRDEK
jgi:hypothetical protein